MNVLSLFDGMSCGQIALNRVGIKIDNYYASEIDKHAIAVTKSNYPNTKHLGSVVNVDVSQLPKIDLLIGGSPCQSFSFAGKRKGMTTMDNLEILTLEHYLQLKSESYEFEGQSYLFWEYMRILTDVRKYNPDVKFLLENVVMSSKWEVILTKAIGIKPILINSSLVSAQNRKRLYWTNIGAEADGLFGDLVCKISQPPNRGILLKDILEKDFEKRYYLSEKMILGFLNHNKIHLEKKQKSGFTWNPTYGDKKAACLRANAALAPTDNSIIVASRGRIGTEIKNIQQLEPRYDGKTNCLTSVQKDNLVALQNQKIRRLTPIECERLQTVPDNYTKLASDSQRYKMLGNGWTVDVIAHIFSYL